MPATYAKDGVIASLAGGNDIGGANSGIGNGGENSGQPILQTQTTSDFKEAAIGGGALASSDSNLGNILQGRVTFVAGATYNNGTYRVPTDAVVGPPAVSEGQGEIEFVIAGGAITSARVVRAGQRFASAPTITLSKARNIDGSGGTPGAGNGAASITVTVGQDSQVNALGSNYGANKDTQYRVATGAVALNAAVSPSTYLNRSDRPLVAGDGVWAIEP